MPAAPLETRMPRLACAGVHPVATRRRFERVLVSRSPGPALAVEGRSTPAGRLPPFPVLSEAARDISAAVRPARPSPPQRRERRWGKSVLRLAGLQSSLTGTLPYNGATRQSRQYRREGGFARDRALKIPSPRRGGGLGKKVQRQFPPSLPTLSRAGERGKAVKGQRQGQFPLSLPSPALGGGKGKGKGNSPSPYPPPRWGEGLGAGGVRGGCRVRGRRKRGFRRLSSGGRFFCLRERGGFRLRHARLSNHVTAGCGGSEPPLCLRGSRD